MCFVTGRTMLACLFLSMGAWSHAGAAVWYVNANQKGPVIDGKSWATAFPLPNSAVSLAKAGDEVWVAVPTPAARAYSGFALKGGVAVYGGFCGTEFERSQRNWWTNPTVLDGGHASWTVWVPDTATLPATLDGFTVLGGGVQGGVLVQGKATIAHNRITGNWGGGILVSGSGSATIVDNTISGNTGNSSSPMGGTGAGGISVAGTATIINNTITGNCGNQGGGLVVLSGGNATLVNCLIARNSSGVYLSAGTVTLSHCDVFGNTFGNYAGLPDPTGQNGNITLDPVLSNPYHETRIQSDSPCVDAGDDTAVTAVDTDIDGQPRITGAHVDIGAYESAGAVWPVPSLTWYVSPSGDDANDGASWTSARKTVGGALASAQGTDEVWVAGGSYAEQLSVPAGVALYGGFAGSETARGQRDPTKNPTVLDGNGQNAVVTMLYNGSVLDGFTVRNGGNSGIFVAGAAIVANNVITGNKSGTPNNAGGIQVAGIGTVTDNVISGNSGKRGGGIGVDGGVAYITCNNLSGNTAVYGGGIYANRCVITMAGNRFTSNSATGSGASQDGGGGLYSVSSTLSSANDLIAGNSAVTSTGGGIYASGGQLTIANDTIADNHSSQGAGGFYVSGAKGTIVNTLIAFNDSGIQRGATYPAPAWRFNDVYGNTGYDYSGMTDPTGTNGNLKADPLFVDRTNGDYHLRAGSPCIDTGDDSVLTTGETDGDGKPRRIGAHVDIGAYEYGTAFYTMADVAKALGIAGGLIRSDGLGTGFPDAVRIARKVAGVDVNP